MKRLSKHLVILVVCIVFWASIGSYQAFADDPDDAIIGDGVNFPMSINTFTISPDPSVMGGTVTVNINVDINENENNGVTYICLYTPSALTVNLPANFTLTAYSGFTSQSVTFTQTTQGGSEPTCPARSNQNGTLYKATSASNGTATYDGSFTATITSGTAGSYDWTLLLEEPAGTPNPLSYNHTVEAPTIVYVSDAPDCNGFGTSGVSCFTSLSDAFNVSSATTVRIVGSPSLGADFTWSTQNPTLLEGWGTSPTLNVTACTTAALDVQKSGVTLQNFTLTGPGGGCTGIAVSGTTISGMTISGFATGISTSGTGDVTIKGNTVTGNGTGISLNNSGARNVYANRVTGNTTTQMACNGGTGA
ncbi:MAG: hypothetical protein D6802_02035, partial [Ardenticatenia bacterium]